MVNNFSIVHFVDGLVFTFHVRMFSLYHYLLSLSYFFAHFAGYVLFMEVVWHWVGSICFSSSLGTLLHGFLYYIYSIQMKENVTDVYYDQLNLGQEKMMPVGECHFEVIVKSVQNAWRYQTQVLPRCWTLKPVKIVQCTIAGHIMAQLRQQQTSTAHFFNVYSEVHGNFYTTSQLYQNKSVPKQVAIL